MVFYIHWNKNIHSFKNKWNRCCLWKKWLRDGGKVTGLGSVWGGCSPALTTWGICLLCSTLCQADLMGEEAGLLAASEGWGSACQRKGRLCLHKAQQGCHSSHNTQSCSLLCFRAEKQSSGIERKKCFTCEMFLNWFLFNLILGNNCVLFHPHVIITSLQTSIFFFFFGLWKTAWMIAPKIIPRCSHKAGAPLIFLAYCSWQMNANHWFLFTLHSTLSGPWRSLIKHPIVTSLKPCFRIPAHSKGKDNTNYTCQETVNTWCITSLPRQLRHLVSLGLNPATHVLFPHGDLPFTAVRFSVCEGEGFPVCRWKQYKKIKVCDFHINHQGQG